MRKMDHHLNHLVFVYGTLKTGEPNHDFMIDSTKGKSKLLGVAKTVKKWPLVIASRYNIPFLLYNENVGMQVIGEMYCVDDALLAQLDELECHPKYYKRILQEVVFISIEDDVEYKVAEISKPWIYFLKNYRPTLLSLPVLNEYSSNGLHGLKYVSSEETSDLEDIY